MATSETDLLDDLNTDDATGAPNPRPVSRRLKAVAHFANKIENRMNRIDQFLMNGPPIEPATLDLLKSIQVSVTNILAVSNTILSRYQA